MFNVRVEEMDSERALRSLLNSVRDLFAIGHVITFAFWVQRNRISENTFFRSTPYNMILLVIDKLSIYGHIQNSTIEIV